MRTGPVSSGGTRAGSWSSESLLLEIFDMDLVLGDTEEVNEPSGEYGKAEREGVVDAGAGQFSGT